MRYYIIDEVAFDEADLEQRKGLTPLLFRLEHVPDPRRLLLVADAVMAEIARDPALAGLRSVFGQLLAPSIESLAPGLQVPDDLWEIRNMVESQFEGWMQRKENEFRIKGRMEGEVVRRQAGEAAFLLRLLERRFGSLPVWARDRIGNADIEALGEWGLRFCYP